MNQEKAIGAVIGRQERSKIIWFEKYIKEQEKRRKHEEFLYRKNLVYLRPFDFDHLRYNGKVVKPSGTYIVTAYRNPISPFDLFFDVYNEEMRLLKTFMVTEEEHREISNLDYHIWNKVDGDYSHNPVVESGSLYEPGPDGKVDWRDFGEPWHAKYNGGRFKTTTRQEYDNEHAPVYQRLADVNEFLKNQIGK